MSLQNSINKTLPKPETKVAYLVSAGLTKPTATKHKYVESRLCELPGPGGGVAVEFIYECQETSMQRRWGTTYAPDHGPGEDVSEDSAGGDAP